MADAAALHRLSRPDLDLGAYLRLALSELDRLVGYTDASIMAYDPDVLLPASALSASARDLAYALHACRNEQLEPDLLKFRELARTPAHVGVLAHREGAGDPRRQSPRWRELVMPAGHRHELRAALVDGHGRCWGALVLLRDRPPFLLGDARLVSRAGRIVARCIARATVLPPTADGPAPASGVLILDRRGRVLDATQSGRAWLDELDGPGAPEQPVPVAALAMLAGASRGADAPTLRLRTARGRWATLNAETLTDGGSANRIVVVVEPVQAASILPLLCAAYGLTRRESEVVAATLQGMTGKEAAARLKVSTNTVQDHLKSIFEKAGVRSRGELAYRLALQFTGAGETAHPPDFWD